MSRGPKPGGASTKRNYDLENNQNNYSREGVKNPLATTFSANTKALETAQYNQVGKGLPADSQ